jgi:aryl-alcohol dehydrogenase-like predicted oxidoreductase
MLTLCRAEGVAVIPWSPLARGRLTGDWDEGSERQGTDRFAQRKPHHLDDALAALSLALSPEETAELERPYRPHEVSGIEV